MGTPETSLPAAAAPSGWWSTLTARAWWPWAKRLVSLGFFALVAWLVVSQARTIAWGGVLTSLRAMPWQVLAGAAVLTFFTYLVYCSFDLVGRHCARHGLSTPLVLLVACVSYAFNLNLGTLVGGVAFRWRLYDHFGLDTGAITHVTLLAMVTNWIGYCLLAGVVFLVWPFELPPRWDLSAAGLRWLGAGLVLAAAGYVLVCWLRHGRELVLRGRRILPPDWKIALLQEALSSLHWMLMAGIIWVLLEQRVDYPAVLATLLVAAVAGVMAHVPAGLGVTEAVFIALLGHRVDKAPLLAALLAYRAVYYLAPLSIAAVAAAIIEFHRRRDAAEAAAQDPAPQM
ncbi:MAG: lysylphosphatidylglycerol synthase domain-containing protein [Pseudomonadota bacterium]